MAYKQTPARGKSNSYSSFQQKGFISPLNQRGVIATGGDQIKTTPGGQFVERPGDIITREYRDYNRETANEPTSVNVEGGINVRRNPDNNKWVVTRTFTGGRVTRDDFSTLSRKERQNFSKASKQLKDQNFRQTPAYQQYTQNRIHSNQYFDTNTGEVKYHAK